MVVRILTQTQYKRRHGLKFHKMCLTLQLFLPDLTDADELL